MTPELRDRFDALLEKVLDAMPAWIHELLEEVPLIVDDLPDDDLVEAVRGEEIPDPEWLCGLYSGLPLTERSVEHSATLPETIHIFRSGIFEHAGDMAEEHTGRAIETLQDVPTGELERQIRITLLHEIGHHFGLEEDDLRTLGYE